MLYVNDLFLLGAYEVTQFGIGPVGIIEFSFLVIEAVDIVSMEPCVEAGCHDGCKYEITGSVPVVTQGHVGSGIAEVVLRKVSDGGVDREIGRLAEVPEAECERIGLMIVLRGIALHGGIASAATAHGKPAGIELCPEGGAGTNQQKEKDRELPHRDDSCKVRHMLQLPGQFAENIS